MNIDINKAMEQMAIAFNTTVDALYPILIKQAFISGVTSLIVGGIALLILVIGTVAVFKYKEKIEYHDLEFAVGTFGSLFTVVALIAIPILITSGIHALLNPEYWAIKELLSTLKPRN